MKNVRQKLSIFIFALAPLCNFACAPQGGGGSASSPGSPAAEGGIELQGTVSGGGGNGCDGKALEAYAKKITTLDEYKLFLRPLLRRMSEDSQDPLVTYMLWAAEEKAWYFAPCELEKLSRAQVGTDSDTDQLARHREHGVQIYAIEDSKNLKNAKTYFQKKSKEKAALLLHEMVMGARLLMKKSAKEQCTVLAKKDAKMCSDPELMAIAESRTVDPDQVDVVVDAADHEAVRAMTSLLAQKDADLSTGNLRAMRERLGFHFPWDRATSGLDLEGLRDAFARSQQMGDKFRVAGSAPFESANGGRTFIKATAHPYFRDIPMTCALGYQRESGISVETSFVTPFRSSVNYVEMEKIRTKLQQQHVGSTCETNADNIFQPWVFDREKNVYSSPKCPDELKRVSLYDYRASFSVDRDRFVAHGVLRDGVLYDQVTITLKGGTSWLSLGKSGSFTAGIVRILVTRDDAPRIRSIEYEPKQVLVRDANQNKAARPVELLPVPNTIPIECVNETLNSH